MVVLPSVSWAESKQVTLLQGRPIALHTEMKKNLLIYCSCYVPEILPIQRKTLFNQSINQSFNVQMMHLLNLNVCKMMSFLLEVGDEDSLALHN